MGADEIISKDASIDEILGAIRVLVEGVNESDGISSSIEPRLYRQVWERHPGPEATRRSHRLGSRHPRGGIRRLDPELVFATGPTLRAHRKVGLGGVPPLRAAAGADLSAGRRRELRVGLDDLLSVVDEAEELSRTRRDLATASPLSYLIHRSAWKGNSPKSDAGSWIRPRNYPAPMALIRSYPRSRRSVLFEVGCLCTLLNLI